MTLMVALIMLIAHTYIGWRAWRLMRHYTSRRIVRLLPLVLLLSFYLLPVSGLIHQWFLGEPDLLTFNQPVTYWFWFGLVFSMQLLTWLLIFDGFKWGTQFFFSGSRALIGRIYRRAVPIAAAVIFVFVAVKMIHDTGTIRVNRTTLQTTARPAGADPLRIVHITDIQGDEYTGRTQIRGYVDRINELQPDLVVFTGDLISYGTDFIDMASEELGQVQAAAGVYAVIGDHDYWAGREHFRQAYRRQGITLLEDENQYVTTAGDSLLLTGVTEVYSKQIARDSLQVLTSGHPAGMMKVLASHQASENVIRITRDAGYQLLLAGHTHGGQLRVPFMFTTFSAAEEDTPYLSGTFTFGDMLMNVDNGLGFTLAPVRYNAPPTISVIDLRPADP